MEANNVEEYLQSARETRSARRTSSQVASGLAPIGEEEEVPLLSDEAVFSEDSTCSESMTPPHTPGNKSDCLPRRPPYYPCTVPQKRDSVRSHPPSVRYGKPHIYEKVEEEQKIAALQQNGVAFDTKVVS